MPISDGMKGGYKSKYLEGEGQTMGGMDDPMGGMPPSGSVDIDCQRVDCVNNKEMKCSAGNVAISENGCDTYQAKGGKENTSMPEKAEVSPMPTGGAE